MSSRFSRLQAQGFRRLRDFDLSFRPLTVMVGANGVGKTSVLEVMSLLAASASQRLNVAINEFSGIGSLLTGDGRSTMRLALSMALPDRDGQPQPPLDYSLSLMATGLGYAIQEESLLQQRKTSGAPFKYIESRFADIKYYNVETKALESPTWEHSSLESSLGQVPRMFKEPELFRKVLASSTLYHALDVRPRAPVRLPQPMRPAVLPGGDGEDLVSCLYYLRETARDRFESIEDTLRAAFPSFERLDFPPVSAGTLTLSWKDARFSQPFFPHQLSEGTLRFLWLTALLHSPNLPAVTLIDEPEVSLHPEMLRLLAGLLREASQHTQLIVATHSDRFVRFLEPSELAVMDMDEDGGASATWADSLDVAAWMDEYTLDDLWRMGRIGGRA